MPPYPRLVRPETQHFNIGTIGAITLATPGVSSAAAQGYFGQINVSQDKEIEVAHLHMVVGGVAAQELHLELWRRRDGAMTFLCAMDYVSVGGETYVTRGGVPAGDLAVLRSGDYLFCQAVTGSTAAPGSGLTIDIHYRFADGYL